MGLKIAQYNLVLQTEFAGSRLSQSKLNRQGVLVSDGLGLADLHPWPELGDATLEQEVAALKAGAPLALGKIALKFVAIDSQLRASKVSAFKSTLPIASHRMLPLTEPTKGFDSFGAKQFKIKMDGRNLRQSEQHFKNWLSYLGPAARFRLDYNFSSTRDEFLSHLKNLGAGLEQVEFFEDPFLFTEESWWEVSKDFNVALAFDRGNPQQKMIVSPRVDMGTASHLYVVTKPLCEDSLVLSDFATQAMRRLVVTSSLGHPVGQAQAAFTLNLIKERHPLVLESSGLASHIVYESNEFSESFSFRDGHFSLSDTGCGWGFDESLKKLQWSQL